MTQAGMHKECSSEDTNHEEGDRQQIKSRLRELELSGLQSGLRGVATHERSVDLVVQEDVGIDVPGDHGEDSSLPTRRSCGGLVWRIAGPFRNFLLLGRR